MAGLPIGKNQRMRLPSKSPLLPITDVLKLPRLAKMVFAIVLILATAQALTATSQTLTTSEIEALKAQLIESRTVYQAIEKRERCYKKEGARLQHRSEKLQSAASDLHKKKTTLSIELKQTEDQAEKTRVAFEDSRSKMNSMRNKMSTIQAQIRQKQAELVKCRRLSGNPFFVCDIAAELGGLNKQIRTLSADMKTTGNETGKLIKRLRQDEQEYYHAAERFHKKQRQFDEIDMEIAVIEGEIMSIKNSLSKIHDVKQDYSRQLTKFQASLAEFEDLKPDSDSRLVVRSLRDESAELATLLVDARKLLEDGLILSSGDRICAN